MYVKPYYDIEYDENLGKSWARWRIKVRNPAAREIICGRAREIREAAGNESNRRESRN